MFDLRGIGGRDLCDRADDLDHLGEVSVGADDFGLLCVVVFTVASVLCGSAPSQGFLIAARLIQGIGGALQASVILAIIVTEFPAPADRARAMSAYVCSWCWSAPRSHSTRPCLARKHTAAGVLGSSRS